MEFSYKKCILINNDCYKKNQYINPIGIVVHSTGANNPYLKRYIQPDDGLLGVNTYKNDWNKSGTTACVNAFIGKDKNGVVRTYQTLPWNMRPWGCASGKNGSYNNSHIQFEVCEDAMTDKKYFDESIKEAINLCQYLIDLYKIPVKNVVSHHESYLKGYGSNHSDIDHWLKRFNKDMNWFRSQLHEWNAVPQIDYSPVFDAKFYSNKYVDLKNAFGTDKDKLLNHFITSGMKEGRQAISTFDVKSYANANADLRKLYKNDLKKYYMHYIDSGKKEGRVATNVDSMKNGLTKYNGIDYTYVYQTGYYADKYPDLKKSFGFDDEAYIKHFVTSGMKEGRQAKASFNVKNYMNRYADLKKAYGNDLEKYYLHFMNYGKKEGRNGK